jgi:hypothetical protein
MPVSRLASESDIQGTDILITDTATLIRTTDTGTGRTTMVGRHFIGITDTECTTRVIIVTTGGKINGEKSSQAGGFNIPPAFIFLASSRQPAPMSM